MNPRKTVNTTIQELPPISKHIAWSVFLFILGRWLWPDIYLSIFIETIIQKTRIVGVLWATLAVSKLLLSIPIGYIEDKVNAKYLLVLSKILYIISWICYFFAGIFMSPILLILGVIANWLASPILFTTNMSLLRTFVPSNQSVQAFGLFHTAFHTSYFIGAIIISFLINDIAIEYIYIAVIIFSTLALWSNIATPIPEKISFRKSLNTFFFHDNIYQKVRKDVKSYNFTLYITLILQFLYGLMDYIGFLFIPLLAMTQNLSLSQVAIIFAVMRIPHILSIVYTSLIKKWNTFIIVCICFLVMSLLLWWLVFVHSFPGILLIAFGISTGLAISRPLILWFISQITQSVHRAEITWVQEFVTRLGEICGSLIFAGVVLFIPLNYIFGLIWIIVACVVLRWVSKQNEFHLPRRSIQSAVKHTMTHISDIFSHRRRH